MKKVKYNNKTYLLPFDDMAIYEPINEMVSVSNRFNGNSVEIPNFALSVYDLIMGSEMLNQWDKHAKGLSWFRKHFPKEYMILLD
tara:strand:+ start:551 stop:805 length:255 start_codon:yes stop_codon:yes gene_type:complete